MKRDLSKLAEDMLMETMISEDQYVVVDLITHTSTETQHYISYGIDCCGYPFPENYVWDDLNIIRNKLNRLFLIPDIERAMQELQIFGYLKLIEKEDYKPQLHPTKKAKRYYNQFLERINWNYEIDFLSEISFEENLLHHQKIWQEQIYIESFLTHENFKYREIAKLIMKLNSGELTENPFYYIGKSPYLEASKLIIPV